MDLSYICDGCGRPNHVADAERRSAHTCSSCARVRALVADAFQSGRLSRCAACGHRELYRRKDFPQRLGIALVGLGCVLFALAQSQYWYKTAFACLIGSVLIDLVLYNIVGDVVICYRCAAQHRRLPQTERYEPFNLSAHERHRQERARLETLAAGAARSSSSDRSS